ncbi:MAG TPA: SMC family ATPase [Ktedonobacteraceae bacterium]|nr:SMC family ATPase [Ktedonobacteraceae bacterium]
MLITRIELENIKSYRHLTVDFRRGTTAISGPNGSGKTTLVEAIGYALFDFLPYNQTQFVREGEKFGRVVVHFLGNDDRPYEVERRCGAGAKWFVYDCEADMRLEQSTDVLDKLHELFGIDRERPLDSLFRDALGVPQGTFTASFLLTPAKRKQVFDALLQIEDYKTAFDYLLEVKNSYRDQAQVQVREIDRLTVETRELEHWRSTLAEKRLEDRQKKEQNVQVMQRLADCRERETVLKQNQERLNQCRAQLDLSRMKHEGAQQELSRSEATLNEARSASQAVENSLLDYRRYQQAETALVALRKNERERNTLRQQHAEQQKQLATIIATIAHLQVRLDEVATARQRLEALLPAYEQQVELEKQKELLAQQVTSYEGLKKEARNFSQKLADCRQQQEKLQRRIAEIEPLRPLAEKLTERVEKVVQLQTRLLDRGTKRKQYEEKRGQLQEKLADQEHTATQLRKAEDYITRAEQHRAEAEELPGLQEQFERLSAQKHRLEGNIESYQESRRLSAGGQCPLLHQPCLNIKQIGLVSLESYFDGLLVEEHTQYEALAQRLEAISARIVYVKKHADALEKVGQYIERRDICTDKLQRLNIDITRLQREIADLEQGLEELKLVDKLILKATSDRDESQKADQQVRELEGFRKQFEQVQAQIEQYTADLEERRRQADAISGSAAQLEEVNQALKALNDPRSLLKVQQETIKQEPVHQQQLQAEQQKRQQAEQRLHNLEEQLQRFAELDVQIGEQEAIRAQCKSGHDAYIQNENVARLLPAREQSYIQAASKAEQAEQELRKAEVAYQQAASTFDEQELLSIQTEISLLQKTQGQLAEEMNNLQSKINELEQNIAHAEALLKELEAAQREKSTLEDLQTMVEQFRKLIKEAAPHVLKAMLNDISAEANRIFGEIMGDRSAQLFWENDYEIVLRRQGVNRTFAQLSGGEQMSAALAVRLALLKKLSTLNIAFFDEPTQNMDLLRRSNLAEQIRRVRGFDQLFVISHDDTFEQGLDSLVRLHKIDGETRLLTEDDDNMFAIEEQVPVHAAQR